MSFIWLLPSKEAVKIAQAKVLAESEAFEEKLRESLRLSQQRATLTIKAEDNDIS